MTGDPEVRIALAEIEQLGFEAHKAIGHRRVDAAYVLTGIAKAKLAKVLTHFQVYSSLDLSARERMLTLANEVRDELERNTAGLHLLVTTRSTP